MTWWKRQSETVRDAVGAVPIVLVFLVAQQLFGDGGSILRAVVIVLAIGVGLTLRRRWPWLTFTLAAAVVATATTGLEFLAIASYTLVAHDRRARPVLVGAVSAVAMVVGFLQYWSSLALEDVAGDLMLIAAIAVLPAAIGQAVRKARDTTAELEARNAELVALREREARHAVAAERFRIARELHDVVAHHVSAMTVRARAGRHVAERDPQAAQDALAYIADAGTQTLTAMGAFVGTLRGQDGRGEPGDLAPQPRLEDIPALLESFRGAGLVVHDDVAPAPVPVGPTLGLNTFRIVQEALTNAMRHGGAERAWVRLWFAAGELHVQVDDNGRGLPGDGHQAGHGLVGIAERAALHEGTSRLVGSDRGGCRLEATLALGHPDRHDLAPVEAPAAGR